MGQVWAVLKFIMELWNAIKVFFGFIKSVKHENEIKEITKETEIISKPGATEEERREATKNLEDKLNSHT